MPNSEQPCHAFTSKNTGLSNRLLNEAIVLYNGSQLRVKVLWDTGATCTCISNEIANRLSMTPTGKQVIHTPSGNKEVNTYIVNIVLPNEVQVQDVTVSDSDIGNQGIDMLIGMNIILIGDFAVSNFNGKTVFTFRIPSKQVTDYVQVIAKENAIGPKHGKKKPKHK